MGFLSHYSGVQRVELDADYWVDVKKCLTVAEKQRAESALTSNPVVDMNGHGTAKVDMPAFHNEMMFASIVDWNLDDEDGTKWALAPERIKRLNIARIPAPVFDQIWKVINELNGPQPKDERIRFPVDGVGSDPDGDAGTSDAGDVQLGGSTVAEAGSAPE